jgi:uncharacterized membrane protein
MGGIAAMGLSLSDDGSTIYGTFADHADKGHVFRWSLDGGAVDLGILSKIGVKAISGTGSTIVGTYLQPDKTIHAYYYSFNGN